MSILAVYLKLGLNRSRLRGSFGGEMDRDLTPPQRQDSDYRDAQRPRQEYHRSNVAIGVSHALKMAGALSPLIILEFVKEPTRAHRFIRIASIATAGLNETLWACRVGRSREQEHRR